MAARAGFKKGLFLGNKGPPILGELAVEVEFCRKRCMNNHLRTAKVAFVTQS
jgi:hypothetical protein